MLKRSRFIRPRGVMQRRPSQTGIPWIAALLMLTASSCDPARRDTQTAPVGDSAGVTIIENHGPDEMLDIRAVRTVDLIPPDSALTAVPWGVAADPMTGRIYVADWTGQRVVAFDASGAYAGSYGRSGDGPGEFRNPTAVSMDPYGALTVWDTGRQILNRWSSEGDLLNEQRPELVYWGPGFAIGSDWLATVTSTTSSSGMVTEQRLVVERGQAATTLHEVPMELAVMEFGGGSFPGPRVLAPSVIWTHRGDSIFFLNGPGYRIDKHAGGSVVSSIRRSVDPIEVTRQMAVRSAEFGPGPYGMFMRRFGLEAEDIVAAVGYEEQVSPVLGMVAAPGGQLWVTRSTDGMTPRFVDILDSSGGYTGSFELPGVPVAFISDSIFAGLRLEETGETIVSLYRLGDTDSDREPMTESRAAANPPVPTSSGFHEFRDCPECPLMVELPPGEYMMGRGAHEQPDPGNPPQPEWLVEAQRPPTEVRIAYSFAIGKYEVTFGEWDLCVDAGGCTYVPDDNGWGRGDRPAINLARPDVDQYVTWISERTGQAYRLPSEAEWEYAARGGTTTTRYWGDGLGAGMVTCEGCPGRSDLNHTTPAGSFPANPFGLHDTVGNVTEWVADCWNDTHEGNPGDGSARTEVSPWWRDGGCERPVRRGSSWSSYSWSVTAAYRGFYHPGPWDERETMTGFRLVRPIASHPAEAPVLDSHARRQVQP